MMRRTFGSRGLRNVTIIALVAVLIGGVYTLYSSNGGGRKIVGYFTSAVGLYPGDQVRIIGVPVGTIDSIEPRPADVKITMSISDDVKIPKDAKALIMSPNLVAARFIQLTPAYTGGSVLPDGASIDLARTGVPVEWDEVKEALTQLSVSLGPTAGSVQGPLGAAINQAADTFDGKGESFHNALRELSQVAGRLGDSHCRQATNRSCSSPETSRRCPKCWPTAHGIWTTRWAPSTTHCPISGDSCMRTTRR
jgi:phospholipid/cholesterol/gamma-HCH transport system substrate-binding protein